MKRNMLACFLAVMVITCVAQDKKSDAHKVHREGTEWTDVWIPRANKDNIPRCMMIGDSIVRGYYKLVCKHIGDKASCTKFATSASVSDPAFRLLLEGALMGYDYRVIHLNNGLHGWDYTEKEYKVGYEAIIKIILAKAPRAKLVLALTTPLKPSDREKRIARNRRVIARNEIVRQLALKYGAVVNDLHRISQKHPEHYLSDGVHYSPAGRKQQAAQVAKVIVSRLMKKDATK